MKLIAIAILFFAPGALAANSFCPGQVEQNSTITLRTDAMTVGEGATESIQLCRRMRVHKLYIQAIAGRQDAYAEVLVNGSVKGTLYVPGRDPHYVVTVEDETNSIELTSIRGQVTTYSVKAVVTEAGGESGFSPRPRHPFPTQATTQMGQLAARVIWIVNQLDGYTSYNSYGTYLLPIRKAAAEVLAYAEARGDASEMNRPYYAKLLNAMDSAQPYMHRAFEVDHAFKLAVELMSYRERIRRVLQ
jgi:hypothetical protein